MLILGSMKYPTSVAFKKYRFNSVLQLALLFFFLFTFSCAFGQETDVAQIEELAIEKVYLHLDKSYYTAGEDIWFKAYLLDGRNHTPNTLSELVYVELIGPDSQIIDKRTLKTSTGSAAGVFKLSAKAKTGTYSLRGYTNYMRNFSASHFYTKQILVNTINSPAVLNETIKVNKDTSLDVQFFPEGGYVINGFLNPIAFKAIDSNGKGTSISGKLIDELGNMVTDFESTHLGMGLFHFIPKQDKTYRALISYDGKELGYDLPKTIHSGVLMTVSNLSDSYKIELRATPNLKIKQYLLIGKQGGMQRFSLAVNANKQENSTIVKVLKDILEEGILELTLVNQESKPIAERLLFHENENGLPQVKISSAKKTYEKRELVSMEITLDSTANKSVSADMSLSVSNAVVNAAENEVTDIKTYLLLNSQVQGTIEKPSYYFNKNEPDRQQHLDMLMRTQGWRQYVLENELVKSSNYFLPEKGITLSGKVVNATDTAEPLTGSVSLTANNSSEIIQDRVKTSEDGTFSFSNLTFTDTTTVLLSANVYYPKKKRNPTLNYKIILDSVSPPLLFSDSKNSTDIDLQDNTNESITQFTGAYEKAQKTSLAFLYNDKTIQLDEAFIAAKKKPKVLDKFQKKRQGMPYREPSHTVDFDDLPILPGQNALLGLQGRVPGLTMGNSSITLRAGSSLSGNTNNMPLILLDGIPIPVASIGEDADGNSIAPNLNDILPITADEVDFIDILKGPRAAIYGNRAGVIAVYSKNGTESSGKNKKRGGSLNFKHPGFASSKKFYKPRYENKQLVDKNIDIRTTLHWQPYLKLNTDGKATISFYTGDIPANYKVILEGITADGTPLYSTTNIKLE